MCGKKTYFQCLNVMEKSKWWCSFINRIVDNEFLSLLYGEGRWYELIFIFQLGLSQLSTLLCLDIQFERQFCPALATGRRNHKLFLFCRALWLLKFLFRRETMSTNVRSIKLLFLLPLEGRVKSLCLSLKVFLGSFFF